MHLRQDKGKIGGQFNRKNYKILHTTKDEGQRLILRDHITRVIIAITVAVIA